MSGVSRSEEWFAAMIAGWGVENRSSAPRTVGRATNRVAGNSTVFCSVSRARPPARPRNQCWSPARSSVSHACAPTRDGFHRVAKAYSTSA
jgi:hypothetical protein